MREDIDGKVMGEEEKEAGAYLRQCIGEEVKDEKESVKGDSVECGSG